MLAPHSTVKDDEQWNARMAEQVAEIERLKVHISNLTWLLWETLRWLPKQRRERILPLLKMENKR